jgi:Lrp/AsnC family transcriptional regulator, leucine-responsive regulatory protein
MPNPTPAIDGTDLEIIELLRANARRSLADIAKAVTLSAPAVKRRIDRLEAAGIITGYTVLLDHAKLGWPLEAFTELRFTGTTKVDEIASVATGLPEVRAVFTMAGDPDALVWIRVRDVDHLKGVVDRLRRSGKVTGTKTLMVLGTWTQGQTRESTSPAEHGDRRRQDVQTTLDAAKSNDFPAFGGDHLDRLPDT